MWLTSQVRSLHTAMPCPCRTSKFRATFTQIVVPSVYSLGIVLTPRHSHENTITIQDNSRLSQTSVRSLHASITQFLSFHKNTTDNLVRSLTRNVPMSRSFFLWSRQSRGISAYRLGFVALFDARPWQREVLMGDVQCLAVTTVTTNTVSNPEPCLHLSASKPPSLVIVSIPKLIVSVRHGATSLRSV
ncbi:hypothetical protein BDY19DRAFT_964305, partial [Irpex rosettiformis]